MDDMRDKIFDAVDEYNARFKDGFPTIPLLDRDGDEVLSIIHDCLTNNKDVYEAGYLEHPDTLGNVLY